MSISLFCIAFDDRRVSGKARLALLSMSDTGGLASLPSIMDWANVDEAGAAAIIEKLTRKGILFPVIDPFTGSPALGHPEMMAEWAKQMDPPPRKTLPGWPISAKRRKAIYERDGHRCHYCGATGRLTLDHKTPQSKGGTHDDDNLVTCCSSCNSAKRGKDYDEFLAFLASKGAPE